MPGISEDIISHKLNIDPATRPITQKIRPMGGDKKIAIQEEVDRLLKANFIKEIRFQTWVANPVLVKKAGGSWRMCIDYRDLNKACPKDSYPLPRIDQLVDATSGHELMSFMDAYSGYNQIKMAKEDASHTAFYADSEIYHYTVMPFGLINAGATYQRMVNRIFGDMIGKTMEAYVDDMIVKSKEKDDHVHNLRQSFERMRQYQVRLNPKKCAFGVQSGKFLGFMVSQRGIEVNPEKLRAIEEMESPTKHKEVQRLNGRLAALNRFLSKIGDKALPFFEVLRANKKFEWTPKCEEAFQQLKQHLRTLPPLAKPTPGEPLLLYISVSNMAVSSVLVKEEGNAQLPVYFVSKTLAKYEINYLATEKYLYALVISARKLRPYFHGHEITVLTDQPLKHLLQRPDTSGRLTKWAIELSEFRIHFAPRTAIKGQALADFIAEFTGISPEGDLGKIANLPKASTSQEAMPEEVWEMFTDGSSNAAGSGAGFLLYPPNKGTPLRYAMALTFRATNNEAEYEALITGLRIAKGVGVKHLRVKCDSQLVVNQVKGLYAAKSETMQKYLQQANELVTSFQSFDIESVPRGHNHEADALSKLALGIETGKEAHFMEQRIHSVTQRMEALAIGEGDAWMTPMRQYLTDGTLPEDKIEALKIERMARSYALMDNELYKKGYSTPFLKCITHPKTEQVLAELHDGDAGCHEGARSLVRKVYNLGYYWPTVNKEANDLVQRCVHCQRYSRNITAPAAMLSSISGAWPFVQWGIDLVGPLPRTKGQKTYILVAIDYFTKWIEAKPMGKTTDDQIISFIQSHIVSRFGVPKVIISDNGPQFKSKRLQWYCEKLNIEHRFASVKHPQTNGQVESANKIILDGLKKRLDATNGSWVDELDNVLWAVRTTPKMATGETPFGLVYGTEAVAPAEIAVSSLRTTYYEEHENKKARLLDLDLADEKRWNSEEAQTRMRLVSARYYNRQVRERQFHVGELVLRRNEFSHLDQVRKLSPKWEGPYKIASVPYANAYRLEDGDGNISTNTFSGGHLKKFYV